MNASKNPAVVQGFVCSMMSVNGSSGIIAPIRRKSTSAIKPTESERLSTWTASMAGQTNVDPRSCMAKAES